MQNKVQALWHALLWVHHLCLVVYDVHGWPLRHSPASHHLSTNQRYEGSTGDSPEQRLALLSLYTATDGGHWVVPQPDDPDSAANASWGWDSSDVSYCRWPGVLCCGTAQQLLLVLADLRPGVGPDTITCQDEADVLALFLSEAGLQGTLPGELQHLTALQVLLLGSNPGLTGSWPVTWQPTQLHLVNVQYTSLVICQEGSGGTSGSSSCQLPAWLQYNTTATVPMVGTMGLVCPSLVLQSSSSHQEAGSQGLGALLQMLEIEGLPQADTIMYSPGFTGASGCTCATAGSVMVPPASGSNAGSVGWRCQSVGKDRVLKSAFQIAFVTVVFIVAVAALVGISYYLKRTGFFKYLKSLLVGSLDSDGPSAEAAAAAAANGEMTLMAKRSRFPGTPSIALAKGRGVLAVSEVLVTWVVTDVEGSTQLWEWDSVVMGAAVEQHNVVLRGLLDQYGGHEVRTDGDSFTLAFHDAADAVAYCIQAQEELLDVPWPNKLLEHPFCAPVRLGGICAARNPDSAAEVAKKRGIPLEQQGPLVMAGLRVRMGISTGIPDDIFVHDLTEHVEYRGEEYELAEDIASIAAGGQIVMGPKTFQRWNRVFTQAPAAENDLSVSKSGMSVQGYPGPQSGKVHRVSSPGTQPQQQSRRRSISILGSLGGLLGGVSSKSFKPFARASMDRTEPPGDGRYSAESERIMNGGDTLLVFDSSDGTKTVAIGRNSQEARAAAATISRQEAEAVAFALVADSQLQSTEKNSQLPDVSNSSEYAEFLKPSAHGAAPVAVNLDNKATAETKAPLPRSRTLGAISFAINTGGPAAADGSRPVRAVAVVGAKPHVHAAQPLPKEPDHCHMPSFSKGPAHGPILSKRTSFNKSSKADGATGQPRPTKAAAGATASTNEESKQTGPIAEGLESDYSLFGTSAWDAPIHNTGGARGSFNIQGSALSMLSSVYSEASRRHSQQLPDASVIRQLASQQGNDSDSYEACARANSAKPAEDGAGQGGPPGESALNPANLVHFDEAPAASRAGGLSMLLRYMGSMAGSIMRRHQFDEEDEYAGAAYAVSAAGSSQSTQQTRIGSKTINRGSSIWGSVSRKGVEVSMDKVDTNTKSFGTSDAVLLDLGYYRWRQDDLAVPSSPSDARADDPQAVADQGNLLHLVQAQSQRLAPRMLLFDWPLRATEGDDPELNQLLPGFLDAPGASSLMFTCMRSLMDQAGAPPPPKPQVTIAFVAPIGLKESQALGSKVSQVCQTLFTSVVREVLLAVGGYESKEVGGQVMAAFEGPRQAVEWAVALQCALLQAPWPDQLADLPCTATVSALKADIANSKEVAVHNTTAVNEGLEQPSMAASSSHDLGGTYYQPQDLFKGIRARIGIWSGPMDRVLPHAKSGRADYLGPPANRAARMMDAAQGGQVFVEEGMMQQVLAEWQAIEESRANAASTAAAAAASPLSANVLVSGKVDSTSSKGSTPKGPPSAASPASHKLMHSGTNLLSSRRSHTPNRQEAAGTGIAAESAVGRSLEPQLMSIRRRPQRPMLLDNVLDNTALLDPATAALSPVKSSRRRTPPWEILPDETAPAVSGSLHALPRASPPPAQGSELASVAGSVGSLASDSAQLPSSVLLELPGMGGQPGLPQVLTIAPAAYMPKRAEPIRSRRGTRTSRSTRSTTSSSGSIIVTPPSQVMKGRKSLNIAVSARPSMDVSAQDQPRLPAAVRASMDVSAAAARRRSLNFGNQQIDTEDLYRAVEAALGGAGPTTVGSSRNRRRLMGEPKLVPLIQQQQVSLPGQATTQQTDEPLQQQHASQASQADVASAMSSAFYSTAVLKPAPPTAAPTAAAMTSPMQAGSRSGRRPVSGHSPARLDAEEGGGPVAPPVSVSTASRLVAGSELGDMLPTQLLPDPAFGDTLAAAPASEASSATGEGASADPDVEARGADLASTRLGRIGGSLRLRPQLSIMVDSPAQENLPYQEGDEQQQQPAGSRGDGGSSPVGKKERRPSLLQAVSFPARPSSDGLSPALRSPTAQQRLMQKQVSTPRSILKKPDSFGGSVRAPSAGGTGSSGSGGRPKQQTDNGVWQIADALYNFMRRTGSNPGSTATPAPTADSTSDLPDASEVSSAVRNSASESKQQAVASAHNSRRPTRSNAGAKLVEGLAAAGASAWDAFVNASKLPVGSRATSGSGGTAARGRSMEKLQSGSPGTPPPKQHNPADRDPKDPGIIAECFKIMSAAAPGNSSEAVESITMIKYTALRQQAALEASDEPMPFAPRLVAAGAYSSSTSVEGTSISQGSSMRSHRWAQVNVNICVHRVGGFRLKGVDKVVNIVQVLPASLSGRLQLPMQPCAKGKSKCVAPASGLVAEAQAFLPDLSPLIDWITGPMLVHEPTWQDDAPQQEEQGAVLEVQPLQHDHQQLAQQQQLQVQQKMRSDELGRPEQYLQSYEHLAAENDATVYMGLGNVGKMMMLPGQYGAHEEDQGSGIDAGFSIGAYHGARLGPIPSSKEAYLSTEPYSGAGTSSSVAGSAAREDPESQFGGGSASQLPNYIPSQQSSLYGQAVSVAPPGNASPVIDHPGDVDGAISHLKTPALLQKAVPGTFVGPGKASEDC